MRKGLGCSTVYALVLVLVNCAAALAEPSIAEEGKLQPSEKAILQLLGVKEKFNEIFVPSGMVMFAEVLQRGSDKLETIFQWNEAHTKVISYSVLPKRTDILQLTKNNITKKCGKPERVISNRLCYGRVVLIFDENNRMEKVTIHFSKDSIQD